MKHLINAYCLLTVTLCMCAGMVAMGVSGCRASHQRIAFNTVYSVTKATGAAYDGYIDAVIMGVAKTNGVPQVSAAFNAFQAAALFELELVQFTTNAMASDTLMQQSSNVLKQISIAR